MNQKVCDRERNKIRRLQEMLVRRQKHLKISTTI